MITEKNIYGIWRLLRIANGDEFTLALSEVNEHYGVLIEDDYVASLISNVRTPNYKTTEEFDNHSSFAHAKFYLMTANKAKGSIYFDLDYKKLSEYLHNLLTDFEAGNLQIEGLPAYTKQVQAFEGHIQKKLDEGYDPNLNFSYEAGALTFAFSTLLILFEQKGLVNVRDIETNNGNFKVQYTVTTEFTKTTTKHNNLRTEECPIKMDEAGNINMNGTEIGHLATNTLPYKYLRMLLTNHPKPIAYKNMVETITSPLRASTMNKLKMSEYCSQKKFELLGKCPELKDFIVHSDEIALKVSKSKQFL